MAGRNRCISFIPEFIHNSNRFSFADINRFASSRPEWRTNSILISTHGYESSDAVGMESG